jgi:hypothetical protein
MPTRRTPAEVLTEQLDDMARAVDHLRLSLKLEPTYAYAVTRWKVNDALKLMIEVVNRAEEEIRKDPDEERQRRREFQEGMGWKKKGAKECQP